MNKYLQHKTLLPPLIKEPPSKDLGIVVVIPCYDEPDLIPSLQALKNCDSPQGSVEVIVLINDSDQENINVYKQNEKTKEQAKKWAVENNTDQLKFYIFYILKIKYKKAGVGTARKMGMDEAVRRLENAGNPEGVILCFDADSNCQKNYLREVEKHFKNHLKTKAAGIHFEHPTEGDSFDKNIYKKIIQYELHLRYFILMQQWVGHPHAFHTIGSSMAVRANAYQQQGGMNRRKAGEDFYFLHKFISIGTFSEIKTTAVIPSPRPSHRVPFGTGKAINKMLESENDVYKTYAPESFVPLKNFIKAVPDFYNNTEDELNIFLAEQPEALQLFLGENDFVKHTLECQKHSANASNFEKRFFKWFNAFIVLKYVHFARDIRFPEIPVEEAAKKCIDLLGIISKEDDPKSLLQAFRLYEKNQSIIES